MLETSCPRLKQVIQICHSKSEVVSLAINDVPMSDPAAIASTSSIAL